MGNTVYDKGQVPLISHESESHDRNILRNLILESQHLLKKSTDSIESIVSDLCGLQYDPNPTIHLFCRIEKRYRIIG